MAKCLAVVLTVGWVLYSTGALTKQEWNLGISDLTKKWNKADDDENLPAIVDLVTEDFQLLCPRYPIVQGKKEYEAFQKRSRQMTTESVHLSHNKVLWIGDTSALTLTDVSVEGLGLIRNGTGLRLLKLVDGEVKIDMAIYNFHDKL